MDLTAAIGQFFNKEGQIELPAELTLAGLAEAMYLQEKAAGTSGRIILRYFDYTDSAAGEVKEFSRDEINTRIKAVAAQLQQVAQLGDRVLILANNSPEYLFGFLGCLYAGVTPVPLYDPTEPGHADHLNAVVGDSDPKVVLTNRYSAAAVRKFFSGVPAKERPRIISVDALPDSLAESFVNPLTTPKSQEFLAENATTPVELPAFLQYTSGSTRTPAGVILTNRSIVTNVLQIFSALHLPSPLRVVSWLPLHHDMGIILCTFCLIFGFEIEIMAPRDFIQQPSRWLRQLNRHNAEEHIYTVIPNFALELAARYARPAEGEELDLSAIDGVLIGSEAVSKQSVDLFFDAFAQYGIERSTLLPSYGMAEASLLISTPQKDNTPLFNNFDRGALSEGRGEIVAEPLPSTVAIVSTGQVARPQAMIIVDPETRTELPDGLVGEVWVHGANVAAGYLDRPLETAETFDNQLAQRLPENSRAAGVPEDAQWLATGDLAVIIDDELYITGRLKDLIIIAGRNHYPQDIEYTVEHASGHVRPDSVAAFAIEGSDVEQLILLVERDVEADPADDVAAVEAIRAAVADAHGIVPADIVFSAPDTIARSSSGKIARRVNQKAYVAAAQA